MVWLPITSAKVICTLGFMAAFQSFYTAEGAPLLFKAEPMNRVAPVLISDIGAAGRVELARVGNGGWAAPFHSISHWFVNVDRYQVTSREGPTIKLDKYLSLVNFGNGSFKVVNRSKQWQNIKFSGDDLVYVVAPKSTEIIDSETASPSLQVFPLSGQQAASFYRYSSVR